MNDEFARQVRTADLGLSQSSVAAKSPCTLMDRRYIFLWTGGTTWEYKGKCQGEAAESLWLSETAALDSFTALELYVSHALWNIYHPNVPDAQSPPERNLRRLNRTEARQVFPICKRGSKRFIWKPGVGGLSLRYLDNIWRIMYRDNDREELTLREMEGFVERARWEPWWGLIYYIILDLNRGFPHRIKHAF